MYRGAGFYYLLTLTAPSEKGQHCKKPGCSRSDCAHVKCPCTPRGGVDLAEWNPTASRRWNVLLRAVEHQYGDRPAYFRAVEVQDGKRRQDGEGRGALHVHAIVWTPRQWSERTIRRLAIAAGFGHAVDLKPIAPGSRGAAGYVAKYVTKSSDRRDEVPWCADVIDWSTGEMTSQDVPATFRTWSRSSTWGKTMRELRLRDRERWMAARVMAELAAEWGGPDGPDDVVASGPEPAD
jgi:hypothetical protein